MTLAHRPNRGRSIRGLYPSIKMSQMIEYQSLNELNNLYLVDQSPFVTWYEAQAPRVEYWMDGKIHHYTPDVHSIEGNRHIITEVKPDRFVDSEANQRLFLAIREWCRESGWGFRVVTSSEITQGFRLANVRQLSRWGRQPVSPWEAQRIHTALKDGPRTVGELQKKLSPDDPRLVAQRIYHLAYHNRVVMDLDGGPISDQTRISISSSSTGLELLPGTVYVP